jgi:hypothetical protein
MGYVHDAENHEAGKYYRSGCGVLQNGSRFHDNSSHIVHIVLEIDE